LKTDAGTGMIVMRRWLVIVGTTLVLAFLGMVLKRLWLDLGQWWTVPLVFGAILAFAYAMSEPHERDEFKAAARWPLQRLGLLRPPVEPE
jgi:hypothetical protein